MRGILSQEMFQCIPEIDFNNGYRYFLGNMDNYTKALMSTLKSVKSKLSLLGSMCLSDEFEGLRTITQTLRIMLGNIGAADLAEETYQVELILLNGDSLSVKNRLNEYLNRLYDFSEHLELLLQKAEVNGEAKNASEQSFLNYDFTKTKESIKRCSDFLERKII